MNSSMIKLRFSILSVLVVITIFSLAMALLFTPSRERLLIVNDYDEFVFADIPGDRTGIAVSPPWTASAQCPPLSAQQVRRFAVSLQQYLEESRERLALCNWRTTSISLVPLGQSTVQPTETDNWAYLLRLNAMDYPAHSGVQERRGEVRMMILMDGVILTDDPSYRAEINLAINDHVTFQMHASAPTNSNPFGTEVHDGTVFE